MRRYKWVYLLRRLCLLDVLGNILAGPDAIERGMMKVNSFIHRTLQVNDRDRAMPRDVAELGWAYGELPPGRHVRGFDVVVNLFMIVLVHEWEGKNANPAVLTPRHSNL